VGFPDHAGEAWGLGVDHAGGLGFPERGALVGGRGQAGADDVFEPTLEILGAFLNSLGSALGGFGLRFGVFGRFGRGFSLLDNTGGAGLEPRNDGVGGIRLWNELRLFDEEEEKGERMFAGKLAAGARAFEGGFGEIDLGLVGLRSATLAGSPDGGFVRSQAGPLSRLHQRSRRLCQGGIGR